jgi:hypothetical protein
MLHDRNGWLSCRSSYRRRYSSYAAAVYMRECRWKSPAPRATTKDAESSWNCKSGGRVHEKMIVMPIINVFRFDPIIRLQNERSLSWHCSFKGTVRPEWIYIRVVDINRNRFMIFNLTLEYLKRLQSSVPLHAKMNPTSCLFGSRFA